MRKLLLLVICLAGLAFRMPHPQVLSHPIDESQINQLNESLDDIWNIQNGLFELDIVTTSKTDAKEGEIWIFNDSGTYKLEFKAGGAVRSITP